ncbi:MAG: hypothetical protein Q8N84_03835 [bacterium]|nr:hypothetical protein [bacterium]
MKFNFDVPSSIVSIVAAIIGLLLIQIVWQMFRGKGGKGGRGDERGPIATAVTFAVVLVIFLDAVNRGPLSAAMTMKLADLLASPFTFIVGLVPAVLAAMVVVLLYRLAFEQGREMESFLIMVAAAGVLVFYYDMSARGPISQAMALRIADIIAGR